MSEGQDTALDRRRIYLMRHGHADYAKDLPQVSEARFIPLSERGRQQAEAAGDALSIVRFDRAINSGLVRAKQTADLVLNRQVVPASILADDPRLEEIGVSYAEPDLTFDAALARVAESYRDACRPGARMGGQGEPFANAFGRAVGAIEDHLSQPGWSTMLVVAHSGINRLILSWAAVAGLGAVSAFEQDPGCINVLDVEIRRGDIDRVLIRSVNLTPYNMVKHGMVRPSLESALQVSA